MRLTRAREIYRQKGARVVVSAFRAISPSPLDRYISLAEDEVLSGRDVNLRWTQRLWCYRRGFLSESYVIYGLNGDADSNAYLSDFARYVHTPKINGRASILANNKIATWTLLKSIDAAEHNPILHGILRQGTYCPVATEAEGVLELLDQKESLVVKDVVGGGGGKVDIMKYDGTGYTRNGEQVSRDRILDIFSGVSDRIITEYVEQAKYAKKIYPKTANTIRILTCFDSERGEAFCPIAVHRFGINTSGGLDNWSQGGLSVAINQDTGELGEAAQFTDGVVSWHNSHPDTNRKIRGVKIPHWSEIRGKILKYASEMPYLPYIGWDVIVTDDDFKIIELNNHPGNKTLQVHEPLLANDRLRKFYEREDVI